MPRYIGFLYLRSTIEGKENLSLLSAYTKTINRFFKILFTLGIRVSKNLFPRVYSFEIDFVARIEKIKFR